jgi:hypothetical protein
MEQPTKIIKNDKLAFLPANRQSAKGLPAKGIDMTAEIDAIIKNYQQEQRHKKRIQEDSKNKAIEAIAKKYSKLPNSEENNEKEKQEKEVVLKTYVEWYKEYSGLFVNEIIMRIESKYDNSLSIKEKTQDEIQICDNKTGDLLYTVYLNDKRFDNKASETGIQHAVFTKKGTEKDYIKDNNGVFISRFVTRKCSAEQIRNLLNKKVIEPRNKTNKVTEGYERFYVKGKTSYTQKEKEFIQLRDGSGAEQRHLSVTHVNETKTVHSNHGVVFDGEYLIKIDLAKVPKSAIFNQHNNAPLLNMQSLPGGSRTKSGKVISSKNENYELEQARYSVIKNRETLLDKIPIEAITEIQVNGGPWQSIDAFVKSKDLKGQFEEKVQREQEQREAQELRDRQEAAQKHKDSTNSSLTEVVKKLQSFVDKKTNYKFLKEEFGDGIMDILSYSIDNDTVEFYLQKDEEQAPEQVLALSDGDFHDFVYAYCRFLANEYS